MSKNRAKKRKAARSLPPPPPEPPCYPAVISEHGHEARFLGPMDMSAAEEWEDVPGASRTRNVVVDVTVEPENPNRKLLRSRVMPGYARLHGRGAISRDHRDACDKYRELREVESGGAWCNGESGGSAAPWQRSNASDAQIVAIAQLRRVHEAIGRRGRLLVDLFIIEDLLAKEIAAKLGEHPGPMWGEIKAALTLMVEHWGIDGQHRSRGSRPG